MCIEKRILTNQDKFEAKALWKTTFKDTDEYISFFFDKVFPLSYGYGLFYDNKLICMLFFLPIAYRYNNNNIKAGYLYGAATQENFRAKGYFSELYKFSEKEQINQGYNLFYCVPQNNKAENIYYKYGYKQRLYRKKYTEKLSSLSKNINIQKLELNNENLQDLYEKYCHIRNEKEGSNKDKIWFSLAVYASGCELYKLCDGFLLYDKEKEEIYDIYSEKVNVSAENSPFCMVKYIKGEMILSSVPLYDSLLFE